jgi:chromosome segregation ATPase
VGPNDIDHLLERQQRQDERLNAQGEEIAALKATMPGLQASIDANTEALREHAKILNEYAGARKALHWLFTAALAVGAFLFGREIKP